MIIEEPLGETERACAGEMFTADMAGTLACGEGHIGTGYRRQPRQEFMEAGERKRNG